MPATHSLQRRTRRALAMSAVVTALALAGSAFTGLAAEAKTADDEFATWEQVVAAQGDVDRQNELIAEINAQLELLDEQIAAAEAAAADAATALSTATEQSQAKYDSQANMQIQAESAASSATEAQQNAAAMAAAMANRVQIDPTIQLLTKPENAENFLQSMSLLTKIGSHNGAVYTDAVSQRNNALQLAKQASAELEEYEQIKADAQAAFDEASNAQKEVEAKKDEAIGQSAQLQAMLVPLQEHRDVLQADYELGEQLKAEAEAAKEAERQAEEQARADQAAAAAAELEASQSPIPGDTQTEETAAPSEDDGTGGANDIPATEAPEVAEPGIETPVVEEPVVEEPAAPAPTQAPVPAPTQAPAPTEAPVATEEPAAPVAPAPAPAPAPTVTPTPAPVPTVAPQPIVVVPAPAPEPEPEPAPAPPSEVNGNGATVRNGISAPMAANAYVTSPFGMREHPLYGYQSMHWGTDFVVPGGTCWAPLYATTSGTISYTGWISGYGNTITFDADDNYTEFLYAHLVDGGTNVRAGQRVNAGDIIGYAGTTGMSTGCHLHFEVIQGGDNVDPVLWLSNRGFWF